MRASGAGTSRSATPPPRPEGWWAGTLRVEQGERGPVALRHRCVPVDHQRQSRPNGPRSARRGVHPHWKRPVIGGNDRNGMKSAHRNNPLPIGPHPSRRACGSRPRVAPIAGSRAPDGARYCYRWRVVCAVRPCSCGGRREQPKASSAQLHLAIAPSGKSSHSSDLARLMFCRVGALPVDRRRRPKAGPGFAQPHVVDCVIAGARSRARSRSLLALGPGGRSRSASSLPGCTTGQRSSSRLGSP